MAYFRLHLPLATLTSSRPAQEALDILTSMT